MWSIDRGFRCGSDEAVVSYLQAIFRVAEHLWLVSDTLGVIATWHNSQAEYSEPLRSAVQQTYNSIRSVGKERN